MNNIKQLMAIVDERLKILGMTRAELLRRAGQSQSVFVMAISRNAPLRLETVDSISKVLGISVSVLLGLDKKLPTDIQIMVDMLLKIPERDRKMISLIIKNYYEVTLNKE